jgi:hypothetical protein
MASLQTLERRLLALESRVSEIEGGYGETIYKLHRKVVKLDLGQDRILGHLGLEPVTEDEIDARIEADE